MANMFKRNFGVRGRNDRVEDLDGQVSAQGPSGSTSSTVETAALQVNETSRERVSRQAGVARRNVLQGRSGNQGVGDTSQFPEAQSVQVVGKTEIPLRGGRGGVFRTAENTRNALRDVNSIDVDAAFLESILKIFQETLRLPI